MRATGGDRRRRDESGAVVPYVLLITAVLVVLMGLALGGGQAMAAHAAAYDEAEQAARAGAAALSAGDLRAGSTAADIQVAVADAEDFMAAAGHPGTVSVEGSTVTCSVPPYPVPTPLLAIVGIGSLDVSARATAVATIG